MAALVEGYFNSLDLFMSLVITQAAEVVASVYFVFIIN